MKKKFLVLEKDIQMVKRLQTILDNYDTKIIHFTNYNDVIEDYCNGSRYLLYVIELNSNDLSNFKVIEFLRNVNNITPIIALLDRHMPDFYKKLYYSKCNDFIVKPILTEEFLFRAFNLSRVIPRNIVSFSYGITYNKNNFCITIDGNEIYLGKKEGALLDILIRNYPYVVKIEELENTIYNDFNSSEKLRSLIRQLRTKLPSNLIITIKGIGYKINLHNYTKSKNN